MRLLKIPVDSYNNILTIMQLTHFGKLIDYLDYKGRKSISAYIVSNALENETVIPTSEQVIFHVPHFEIYVISLF